MSKTFELRLLDQYWIGGSRPDAEPGDTISHGKISLMIEGVEISGCDNPDTDYGMNEAAVQLLRSVFVDHAPSKWEPLFPHGCALLLTCPNCILDLRVRHMPDGATVLDEFYMTGGRVELQEELYEVVELVTRVPRAEYAREILAFARDAFAFLPPTKGDYPVLDTTENSCYDTHMTLNKLLAKFVDEDACKTYLVQRRWPDGVKCPKCGNTKVFHVGHRPFHWVCKKCNRNGYRFSVISGTVFENTKYPLREWFKVVFLMSQSKKGMSALQIHRMLGTGSYETAWYMCHRIRAAMKSGTWRKLMGTVEVDETYVGGKDKNRHWSKKSHITGGIGSGKVGVIGAISRKGNVVCRVIESTDAKTLEGFVRETVSDKVDLVATDEWAGYRHLGKRFPHGVVRHAAGEYVHGNVHTNNLDNFWSLLKRGVIGNYHQVSKKYLPLYLAEFSFRHNNRGNPDMFDTIVAGC